MNRTIESENETYFRMAEFKRILTRHLVTWKKENISDEPGLLHGHKNDKYIPETFRNHYPGIYSPIKNEIINSRNFESVRISAHIGDPGVAGINLFYPILKFEKNANMVLSSINPSFRHLAVDHLDGGFRFFYRGSLSPVDLVLHMLMTRGIFRSGRSGTHCWNLY